MLPVPVIDQDRDRPSSVPIAVVFSQDKTGCIRDEARRKLVTLAAEAWACFFDGDGLEQSLRGPS